jgi:hypothetical protein
MTQDPAWIDSGSYRLAGRIYYTVPLTLALSPCRAGFSSNMHGARESSLAHLVPCRVVGYPTSRNERCGQIWSFQSDG